MVLITHITNFVKKSHNTIASLVMNILIMFKPTHLILSLYERGLLEVFKKLW
jgi:hypothetical protein